MSLQAVLRKVIFGDQNTASGVYAWDGTYDSANKQVVTAVTALRDWATGNYIGTINGGLPVTPLVKGIIPIGYFQASISTTPVKLLDLVGGSVPQSGLIVANTVFLQPEVNDIRFRDDGGAISSSLGWKIYGDNTFSFSGIFDNIWLCATTNDVVTLNIRFTA